MKTDEGLWKFNPSGLYPYVDCKTCFWKEQYYGRKPSLPLRLNEAVDAKLKNRYDLYRKQDILPPEIADKLPGYKLYPDQQELDDWRNWRKGLSYKNKADGYVLTGAVDEIMIDPSGKLVATDYKSSGDPPKEDKQKYYILQLHAYALILKSLKNEVADEAYLLHYFPKNREDDSLNMKLDSHVDRVEINLPKFKRTLAEMVEFLKSPKPKLNPDCRTCAWLSDVS